MPNPVITMPKTRTMTAETGCSFSCADDDNLIACGKFNYRSISVEQKACTNSMGLFTVTVTECFEKKYKCKNLRSYVSYCKGLYISSLNLHNLLAFIYLATLSRLKYYYFRECKIKTVTSLVPNSTCTFSLTKVQNEIILK